MGSDIDTKDEQPRHEVKLNDFVLGQTPVTWQLWWEYCSATGTPLPLPGALGRPLDHPVVNVSWFDIMGTDGQSGFCGWASDVLGYRVLLPTEAQFEYAALGGESGKAYPWGDRFDRDALWWSGGGRLLENKTAPVYRENKTYKNRFGLIDMAGHCTQWCLDWFEWYPSTAATDPRGPIFSPVIQTISVLPEGQVTSLSPEMVRVVFESVITEISDNDSN